jgi:putative membrane protein
LEPQALLFMIAAVMGAHLVFQFLPAIFLSIPDDTVVTSVLPGHRLALCGRGREALLVCASSALAAAIAASALLPFSIAFLPLAYSFIEPNMAVLLVAASAFLIASEREWGKMALALFVFLLTGALGIATMRIAIHDPLFPAFCGLFAGSGILLSFSAKRELPAQAAVGTRLDYLPFVGLGVLLGMLSDLMPGIAAPAQIAVFASVLVSTGDARKFLALVSSIAASHAVFAFGALVSIGKAREGTIAIMNGVSPIMAGDLPMLVGALLLSMGMSAFILVKLAGRVQSVAGMDSRAVSLGVLSYLLCAVAIISGGEGLLLFATASAAGLLPPLLGIRRTHVMGLIIVPSILLAL